MILNKSNFALATLLFMSSADAFSPSFSNANPRSSRAKVSLQERKDSNVESIILGKNVAKVAATMMLGATVVGSTLFPGLAFANEIGVEVEAPTLYTGETVEICIKRGPLGACTKTTTRTAENDNDKASKYFRDPSEAMKEKYSAAQLQAIDNGEKATAVAPSEGNELIEKLKQASADNREKNDRIVRARTLQNDIGASFSPLDNQVVILNVDGENYTLLKAPQAMRLKKEGYIKDRRFVTMPTQQVIDDALEAPAEEGSGGIGAIFKGFFGNSD